MKTLSILLMLSTALMTGTVAAQDTLEEAKAHYAAAAYEEALSTLTRVDATYASNPSSINRVELEQYRAFCFIALGKLAEAERAVASLVAADPRYVPSATVASPKVLQLVSEMRRKELPAVARRLFDDGKAAFKEKELPRAQRNFRLLLQLLDDPVLKGRPENEDLRILAEGFAALLDAPAPSAPAAQPAPATETVVRTSGTPAMEPPVAIQQTLPEWMPTDKMAGSRDYVGSIKVIIGIDGRVKSATIEKATHPIYDARLLQVSRGWLYKPATRNGEPVESEKVIAIQLRRKN
jgi:tetratricopeptide (TPR) repeat protein